MDDQMQKEADALSGYVPDEMSPSWIYFAGDGALAVGSVIKIGISTNIRARMKGLRQSCGYEPTVYGSVPGHLGEENAIHDLFAYARTEGEWFAVDEHLLKFITSHTNSDIPDAKAKPKTKPKAGKAKGRTMPVCCLSLPQSQVNWIASEAKRLRISKSQFFRNCLDEFIAEAKS